MAMKDKMVSIHQNKLIAVCINMHETAGKVARCKRQLGELISSQEEHLAWREEKNLKMQSIIKEMNEEFEASKKSDEEFKIRTDLLLKKLHDDMDELLAPPKKLKL